MTKAKSLLLATYHKTFTNRTAPPYCSYSNKIRVLYSTYCTVNAKVENLKITPFRRVKSTLKCEHSFHQSQDIPTCTGNFLFSIISIWQKLEKPLTSVLNTTNTSNESTSTMRDSRLTKEVISSTEVCEVVTFFLYL